MPVYDKERAPGAGRHLREGRSPAASCALLMELDWVIGFLDLTRESRRTVAAEWAKFFLHWGGTPGPATAFQNRQEILIAVESGTAGEREVTWSGREPYRDRFTRPTPSDLFDTIRARMSDLGIETSPLFEEGGDGGLGQIPMEALFLTPLRKALPAGKSSKPIAAFGEALMNCFSENMRPEFFAEILSAEDESGVVSPSLAPLAHDGRRELCDASRGQAFILSPGSHGGPAGKDREISDQREPQRV